MSKFSDGVILGDYSEEWTFDARDELITRDLTIQRMAGLVA
jgi:hypothetical protein